MSSTRILVLGAVVMLLYLGFPFAMRAIFPRIAVGRETAVTGRVTGTMKSRHYHGFFLNGHHDAQYDFSDFVRAPAAAGAPAPADSEDLGFYLQTGDSLTKSPHAAELTVRRGGHLTQWVFQPE
jgi:hypothetical protein